MAISKLILNSVTQMDVTDTTATAPDVASGMYFYTAAGVRTEGTASGGGGATIQPLSVTQNGTYTAPTGVDGYSPVTVNVSGGGGISLDDVAMKTISGVISGNASYVASMAFQSCSLLTGAIFPNVLSIGASAFSNCKSLSHVEFPTVESLQHEAFYMCESLSEVSFPEATYINNSAFRRCYSLTKASLPSVLTIEAQVFSSCALLSDVYIPNVKSIGSSAFWSCTSLAMVRLEQVTRISTTAFARCTNLSQVYILASSICTLYNNVFSSTPIANSTYLGYWGSIYVPSSLVSSYKTANNWSVYADRITSYSG